MFEFSQKPSFQMYAQRKRSSRSGAPLPYAQRGSKSLVPLRSTRVWNDGVSEC